MKTYGGVDVQIHVLLTSALVGGESAPRRYDLFDMIMEEKMGVMYWNNCH
jgi:hypothetical protein